MVPGGRKGECLVEMAPFCSFFLEEQSSDHNPWGGADAEWGSQCRQSSQCHADDPAWNVCPSLFLIVLGLGKEDISCGSICHIVLALGKSRVAAGLW